MRISDWSSDVCSSDLGRTGQDAGVLAQGRAARDRQRAAGRISLGRWPLVLCAGAGRHGLKLRGKPGPQSLKICLQRRTARGVQKLALVVIFKPVILHDGRLRSEEHTSELQSLMRISYAVFCLTQKNHKTPHTTQTNTYHIIKRIT